jgi:hypothetical protein
VTENRKCTNSLAKQQFLEWSPSHHLPRMSLRPQLPAPFPVLFQVLSHSLKPEFMVNSRLIGYLTFKIRHLKIVKTTCFKYFLAFILQQSAS